jgi:two-component system chemotaxis response regulator CheB
MAARGDRDIIVVGASSGGIHALTQLVSALPADLPAAVAITIHRSPDSASYLPGLLARSAGKAVEDARDGQAIQRGHVYFAPPDHHLLFRYGVMRLDRGPKQHHTRPAIDPMFVSAAEAYGERVIGMILTGNLSDGVAGLVHIKSRGGISLVQDPQEAEYPSMPQNAITYDSVDAIFTAETVQPLLQELVRGEPVERARLSAERGRRSTGRTR